MKVLGCRAGSMVAEFRVSPPNAASTAAEFLRQSNDRDSALFKGKVTDKTVVGSAEIIPDVDSAAKPASQEAARPSVAATSEAKPSAPSSSDDDPFASPRDEDPPKKQTGASAAKKDSPVGSRSASAAAAPGVKASPAPVISADSPVERTSTILSLLMRLRLCKRRRHRSQRARKRRRQPRQPSRQHRHPQRQQESRMMTIRSEMHLLRPLVLLLQRQLARHPSLPQMMTHLLRRVSPPLLHRSLPRHVHNQSPLHPTTTRTIPSVILPPVQALPQHPSPLSRNPPHARPRWHQQRRTRRAKIRSPVHRRANGSP